MLLAALCYSSWDAISFELCGKIVVTFVSNCQICCCQIAFPILAGFHFAQNLTQRLSYLSVMEYCYWCSVLVYSLLNVIHSSPYCPSMEGWIVQPVWWFWDICIHGFVARFIWMYMLHDYWLFLWGNHNSFSL